MKNAKTINLLIILFLLALQSNNPSIAESEILSLPSSSSPIIQKIDLRHVDFGRNLTYCHPSNCIHNPAIKMVKLGSGTLDIKSKVDKAYIRKANSISTKKTKSLSETGQPKILHGPDNRLDLYDEKVDAEKINLAKSVVLLTDNSHLTSTGNGSWELNLKPLLPLGVPLCKGEKFDNQKTGGWCTGFMVSDDLIATAGHCVESKSGAQNTIFVFGFEMKNLTEVVTKFPSNQVYFGKDLVAQSNSDSSGDFAIVRLDRKITAPNALPLRVRRAGNLKINSNIGVIGHPSGLPMKVAFGPSTIVKENMSLWLRTNMDTFGGNSGSPVFSPNDGYLLEGILVSGELDYIYDSSGQCSRPVKVKPTADSGREIVTKASVFKQHIPKGAGD